jgi:hypothetical protein
MWRTQKNRAKPRQTAPFIKYLHAKVSHLSNYCVRRGMPATGSDATRQVPAVKVCDGIDLNQLEPVMPHGQSDQQQRRSPDHEPLDHVLAKIDPAAGAFGRFGADGVFTGGTLPQDHGTPPVKKRELVGSLQ